MRGQETKFERLCYFAVPLGELGQKVPGKSPSLLPAQDADAAYMGKAALQSNLDILFAEVNFLKYLFETVSSALTRSLFLCSHPTRVWAGRGETCNPA
jgi:hypothetical protein